jgi:hypothetical protein
MKKFIIAFCTLAILLFNSKFSSTQVPMKKWDKTLGGDLVDFCRSVIQITNGEYLVGGTSNSNISGDKTVGLHGYADFWVVKIDNNGNKIWDRNYGGDKQDELICIIQTSDGGFLLGGHSWSDISGEKSENSLSWDFWILKIDADGNKVWDKTFGGDGSEFLSSIIETSDSGYLLGGVSESNISGYKTEESRGDLDYWIIKIDSEGNRIWDKTFGGDKMDYLTSVVQVNDGGYIVGGYSHSDVSGDKTDANRGEDIIGDPWDPFPMPTDKGPDYWIIRLDNNGNKIWDKTYGGQNNDNCRAIVQDENGSIFLAGSSDSNISGEKSENSRGYPHTDFWILKIDIDGNLIWDKTIGGDQIDDCYAMALMHDNSMLLGGSSSSSISGEKSGENKGSYDFWIVNLDGNGNIIFDLTLGGNSTETCYTISKTNDGGILLGGDSWSDISGDKSESHRGWWDYWIVKLGTPNQPPVANDDNYEMFGNTLAVGAPGVLTNDTDEDSNPLTAQIVSQPTKGTVVLNADGSFTYTIGANFDGNDSFTYKANDGTDDSNVATVNIKHMLYVTNLNDSGEGSLRWTMTNANSHPGPDEIRFAVAGTINVLSQLPELNDATGGTTIDGTSAPGYLGTPLVALIGPGTGTPYVNAISITSTNNIIQAIQISSFWAGISVLGSSASGNVIIGNYIGNDGSIAVPNGRGIQIYASNNRIGGTTIRERNVLSGNELQGLYIGGSGNLVQGNYIGTDVTGTKALANLGQGVVISGSNNIVGGTTASARNILSGNKISGISISTSGSTNNLVQGNFIGTDVTGNVALPNQADGVQVDFGPGNNTIGGTEPGAGNVISGNLGTGVVIRNNGTLGNKVQGNLIGTNATGTSVMGNYFSGIHIRSSNNLIGGTEPGARNVISGTVNGAGIFIGQPNPGTSSGNVIQGNFIGTDITGIAPMGNENHGIYIQMSSSNTIGGTNSNAANIIAYNYGNGVGLLSGTNNSILHNSIFSNTKLGIDNGTNGVSYNDPGDGDIGANNLQNFPVINSITTDLVSTTIEGTLNSFPNTTYIIEFFSNSSADPSGYGEGEHFIGSASVTTDENGDVNFSEILPVVISGGEFITATATDPDGNTSEFSAALEYISCEPPVAVCQNITIQLDDTGQSAITVSDIDNGSEASCGLDNISKDQTSFDCTNIGENTVTLTITDINGANSNCTSIVTVIDVTAPVADVETLPDATGECEVTVTAPTATDNCEGTITATTADPVYYNTQGTYLITWTYDDGNGNTTTQNQTVVVDDVTAPVADVETLPDATGECEVTVIAPTATDNCEGTITATTADPVYYNTQGTYLITWTYDDGNGNTTTQNQTVVVDDVTAPVADVETLPDATGECEVTVIAPTATDNCEGTITATTADPVYYNTQGTYLITWTYDDGNGNTTTQNQTVVVDDVTAPVADVETLPDATGECEVTVIAPTATDNCEGTITATTADPVYYDTQGTYTITWTYDDGNGNTTTQNQTVVVDDVTAPVADVETLPDATGECEVTVTAPTATDNCEGTITATTTDPVYYDVQGTYVITWTYNDGNGNSTTQTQTVVVDDVTAPVGDVETLPNATGECKVTVTAPTATDNCEGTITATTTDPVYYDAQGTYVITWTYNDGNGNSTTQNQTVVVDDVTAPVADVETLPNATGECEVTVTAPTATDNCEGTITATTADPVYYDTQGTYLITWTYDDGNGNTTTQNQTVVVDDVTAPVADVETLPNATGECEVTVTPPTATDNCEGTITATTTDPVYYDTQGTYLITWTYDDGNGNTTTQNQTVVVDDVTAPVADVETLPGATGECEVTVTAPTATDNCEGTIIATTTDPVYYDTQGTYTITWTYDDGNGNTTTQNQTFVVDDVTAPVADVETLPDATGECEVTVTAPTATDNCEGTITATTADPVYYDTQGTYTITWTYDDGNGNTTTQNQTVVVDDVTAPVADVETLPDATGECEVTVTPPTATDNCEGTITATTANPVYYDTQGTYLITWTYDDGNGNTSTQNQTVVVDDVTAPVADVETLPGATGECEVTVTAPTATDNCEGTIIATTTNPVYYDTQGTYTITWTYDDGNGNTTTQNQTVVVDDLTAPTVLTKNITVQLDDYGTASITASAVDNGSFDNCGIESMDISQNIFTCENIGDNIVTLTVSDIGGNQSIGTAIVTVLYSTYEIGSVIGPEHPMQLGTSISLAINLIAPVNADVKVIWDDGMEDIYNGSTGIIYAEHIYQTTGVFSVTVQIEDPCSQSEVYIFNYIVIYDPDGGFVTGGGWIDSPEGAYKPDPLLTGKANFGFVAKYKKGANTPDGKTEFQFKAGNLNFKSSEYEYLVISGAKAQFKGSGTINGSGNYGFMLSAIDADLTPSAENDKFRIKIWSKADDVIVYDNNIEGGDNADPSTEIGGGSITIHSSNNKSAELQPLVKYSSLKVYPNPFSSKLMFEFVSPEDTHARIDLFDAAGRKVRTLFDSPAEGGVYYNAEFKPTSEVSGMYFYKMTLGEAIYNDIVIYKKE